MTYIGSLSGSSSSSSGYSMPSNTNSIQGLASGMDTQSIVNGLVQAAQAPLVSILQQRQTLIWKAEQYQQVNAAMTNLQTSLSNLGLQSSFMVQQASSTNSTQVSGSSSGLAPNGTYSVSVSQLAQGTTISSTSSLSTNLSYGDTALDQLPSNAITGGVFNITVNGESIAIDPTADTINSVLQKISSDTATGAAGFYDANSGKVVLQSTATGSSAHIALSTDATSNQLFNKIMGLSQPTFSQSSSTTATSSAFTGSALATTGVVEINGTKISLTQGESLTNAAAAINNAKIPGISATANMAAGTLSLSTTDTTSGGIAEALYSPLNISDPSNILQLTSTQTGIGSDSASQDAMYSVNGVSSTNSTNSPVFNGVTLNLGGTTGSNPVTVTVSTNTSQVVQTITNFVQTYNQTLQTMQGLYNQQRDYSYQPLTAAQESQMTQPQIDEWNQKAQAGMLSYDPTLGSAISSLENMASTILSGMKNNGSTTSLASIGITPISPMNGVSAGSTAPGVTTTGWNTYGLLQINTAQLTQAVQSNPQAVMNLFTNSSTDTTQEGLAKQLYSTVSNSITQINQEAGTSTITLPTTPNSNTGQILLPSTGIDPNADLTTLFGSDAYDTSFIGSQISSIDTQAEQFQKQISEQQTMWQNQFAQMEQSIQSLNSQQSQLIGMLG